MISQSTATTGGVPPKSGDLGGDLHAYAPAVLARWSAATPADGSAGRHRRLAATMVFTDISGFTALTERLARRGPVGAELMSDTLDRTFGALLAVAREEGADLLKWGGDAFVLLFDGADHAPRAARAAYRMRASLRALVRANALPVRVNLGISQGIHSGEFDLFLVGDPASHRELILTGPQVSELVLIESLCGAGQIGLSASTVDLLPYDVHGEQIPNSPTQGRRLLCACPPAAAVPPRRQGDEGRAGGETDLAAMIPPAIRAHLTSERGESEHRSVAVGFVQFSGTDPIIGKRGPSRAIAPLEELVRNVQQACLAHGVTFFESDVAVDGGKIMLTAGAPRSIGEDAERLIRTARDIVGRAGILPVRIGVNAGHVFSGDFGPVFRRTYSIKGDAVNLAARLLGHAAPGEVVATAYAVSRVRTRLRDQPLEPFLVKGKKEPVEAVRVDGVVEGIRAEDPLEPPFVGRREELASLRRAVLGALDRRGAVVDLVGEPGIGKSRLIAELGPLPADLQVVSTTSGNYEADTPYFTFRVLLHDALGIGPDASADVVVRRLESRVRHNAPHLLPWLPLLGLPLDVDLPQTPQVRDLDPEFRGQRLEEVVAEFLTVALPTPTLLVFEDAHLMDVASAGLLRQLLRQAPAQPWTVIVTRREFPLGFVPESTVPHLQRLPLGPLPEQAAMDLLEAVAGDTHLGLGDLHSITARAEGNPLYLAAIAALAGRTGGAADVPASIEDLLRGEIDRLNPAQRRVLRYAAVLGTRFSRTFLRDLLPEVVTGTSVEDTLAAFVRRVDAHTLEFRHALVRDVAYAGLPFGLRRQIHGRVAAALEQTSEASPQLLSLHFHAAAMHQQAASYSRAAGARAREKYAYREAATLFERAADSLARLPHEPAQVRADTFVELGECLDLAGSSAEAIAAFRRARALRRDDPVAFADLLYKEARITIRTGKYSQALRLITRALRTIEPANGPAADVIRSRLATRYGFCRYVQGHADQAIDWSRRGVAWADASGDAGARAHCYNALHGIYGGSPQEDRPYGDLALALFVELGDLSGQAMCLNNLAVDAYRTGQWSDAGAMFGQAADAFRRLGDEANEGSALYNRADVLVAQRRFADAIPDLRLALRLARGADDEELVALTLREGARAHAGVGNLEQAWELFDDARARMRELHLTADVALLDAARAEAMVEHGQAAEALPLLVAAEDDAVDGRVPGVLTRMYRVHASAELALGHRQAAAERIELARAEPDGKFGGFEDALLDLAEAECSDGMEPASAARMKSSAALAVLRDLGVSR